jgi:hypothetical protein
MQERIAPQLACNLGSQAALHAKYLGPGETVVGVIIRVFGSSREDDIGRDPDQSAAAASASIRCPPLSGGRATIRAIAAGERSRPRSRRTRLEISKTRGGALESESLPRTSRTASAHGVARLARAISIKSLQEER